MKYLNRDGAKRLVSNLQTDVASKAADSGVVISALNE